MSPQCPTGRNPVLWAIACEAVARHNASYDSTEESAAMGAANLAARNGSIQRGNVAIAARAALSLLPAVREAIKAEQTAVERTAVDGLRCGAATVRVAGGVSATRIGSWSAETPAGKVWAELDRISKPGDVCVVESSDSYYPNMHLARGESRIRVRLGRRGAELCIQSAAEEDAENAARESRTARNAEASAAPKSTGEYYRPSTGDRIKDAAQWAEDAYRCGDSWSDE